MTTRTDRPHEPLSVELRRLRKLQDRVDDFLREAESVQFRCDEQQAPPWTPNWREYLQPK